MITKLAPLNKYQLEELQEGTEELHVFLTCGIASKQNIPHVMSVHELTHPVMRILIHRLATYQVVIEKSLFLMIVLLTKNPGFSLLYFHTLDYYSGWKNMITMDDYLNLFGNQIIVAKRGLEKAWDDQKVKTGNALDLTYNWRHFQQDETL